MEQQIETIKPTMNIALRIWWWMFLRRSLLVLLVGGITFSFVLSFINDGESFLNSLVFLLFSFGFGAAASPLFILLQIFLSKKIIGVKFKNFILSVKNNNTKEFEEFGSWNVGCRFFWFVFWRVYLTYILVFVSICAVVIYLSFFFSSLSGLYLFIFLSIALAITLLFAPIYLQLIFIKKIIGKKFKNFTLVLKDTKDK